MKRLIATLLEEADSAVADRNYERAASLYAAAADCKGESYKRKPKGGLWRKAAACRLIACRLECPVGSPDAIRVNHLPLTQVDPIEGTNR